MANNEVVTFGCRLNAYESEAIKEALKKSDQENLIVFNSCAVTSQAESQLRSAIRKARKENPEAKIVVTGCAAQIDPEKYAKMMEIDLVLGNAQKTDPNNYSKMGSQRIATQMVESKDVQNKDIDIAHKDRLFFESKKEASSFLSDDETAKIIVNDIMSVKDTAPQLVSYFEEKTRAFLEIQNGCNHRCTFCIIPFGRGNSRSVSFGDIVSKVKMLVEAGHKEIVLTGVDISGYGEDLAVPITLSQMIKRLLKLVPDLPRLRLSSIDVAEIDEDMIDLIAHEPRLMPYLHLSVQSGDDMILKRMKRRHNRQQVLDFCHKVRQLRPEITFGSDIIAGFPTESDAMFENSVRLIKEAGIIFNHIFPYSIRQGTPAAKMPQINGKIIKERAKILRQTSKDQLQQFLKQQLNKTMTVITQKDNIAKSENFLDVKIRGDVLDWSQIIDVKIIDIDGDYLIGQKLD